MRPLIILILVWAGMRSCLYAQGIDELPYRWIPAFDISAIGVGFGLAGTGAIIQGKTDPLTEMQITALSPNSIPAFDRGATNYYSGTARLVSDIPFYGQFPLALGSCILFSLKKPQRLRKFILLSTMYWEGMALTLGSTQLVKSTVLRPRPFLFNESLSLEYRANAGVDGRFAFFSGHTSSVFYSAVFLSIVYQDLYPERWTRFLVWGCAMGTATTTGLMRIFGGKHFPTDVLVGAGVGSLFGWLVPFMHKLPRSKNNAFHFYPTPAAWVWPTPLGVSTI